MGQVDWLMKGRYLKNCIATCPSTRSHPTRQGLRGLVGMLIERGHYANVELDGSWFTRLEKRCRLGCRVSRPPQTTCTRRRR